MKVGDAGLGVLHPAQARRPLDDPARDRVAEQDDLRTFKERPSAIDLLSQRVSVQHLEPRIYVCQPSQIRPQIRRDHDYPKFLLHRCIQASAVPCGLPATLAALQAACEPGTRALASAADPVSP